MGPMYVIVSNYVRPDSPNLLRLQDFFAKHRLPCTTVTSVRELLDVYTTKGARVAGMVMTGSSRSAQAFDDYDNVRMNAAAFVLFDGVPKLCICFSHQLVAAFTGATLTKMPAVRRGTFPVSLSAHPLFANMSARAAVRMSHQTCVADVPPNFRAIAHDVAPTSPCRLQGMADDARRIYTVQFHPEALPATHTILCNFVALCKGARKRSKAASRPRTRARARETRWASA